MTTPLRSPLNRLRQQVRRILLIRGLSLCSVVLLTTTTLAVITDWLVHFDASSQRRLVLTVVVLVNAAAAWRWLLAPLKTPLDDLTLAMRIESRFPRFRDQLTSGLQFSQSENDATWGSPALQQGVIDQALSTINLLDIDAVVERRGARRATLAAAGFILLATVLVTWKQLEAATGLDRLFLFSEANWPRQTQLRFLDDSLAPSNLDTRTGLRIPLGESVELIVENSRGQLPSDSVIEIRRVDPDRTRRQRAAVRTQPLRTTSRRDVDGSPREVGIALLTPADETEALEFRARGGDDVTAWFTLRSIPPPLLESLTLTLHPPAYTGRTTHTLAEGVGDIQALIGTRVEVLATINQRIREATLTHANQSPLPAHLAADGRTLDAEFTISSPGVTNWFLTLIDQDGLSTPRPAQFELRALADRVPNVEIVSPPGNIRATPGAELPLKVIAGDDLAIRDVNLVIRSTDRREADARTIRLHGPHAGNQPLTIQHLWPLHAESIAVGTELQFHVEATDAYDLGDPHTGRSTSRTLTLVSKAAKKSDLLSQQAALLKELSAVLARQRTAHAHIADLQVQWETAGRLRPGDLEILLATELNQRQIAAQLADENEGLVVQARRLAGELVANRLDDPDAIRYLDRIVGDLSALGAHALPSLDQSLADARRRLAGPTPSSSGPPLAAIERLQAKVVTTLESLLDDLSSWQNRRELHSQAHQLLERQQQLLNDTASRPEETLDKPIAQLDRQQRADLKRMARQQSELADRLDRLTRQLEEAGLDTTGSIQPDWLRKIQQARRTLRTEGTAAAMRDVADQVELNHVGRAHQSQQKILEQLKQLENALHDRATSNAQSRLDDLDSLLSRLNGLHALQSQLHRDTKRVSQQPDSDTARNPLLARQAALLERSRDALDTINRLQLLGSQAAGHRVVNAMQRATRMLARPGVSPALLSQAAALDAIQATRLSLENERQRSTRALADKKLQQWIRRTNEIRKRQAALVQDTRSLYRDRQDLGRWTRPLLRSLRKLAGQQQTLAENISATPVPVEAGKAFATAIRQTAGHMTSAADAISGRRPEATVQRSQQQALTLLDEWLKRIRATHTVTGPQPPADGQSQPAAKPSRTARKQSPDVSPAAPETRSSTRPARRSGQADSRASDQARAVRDAAVRRSPWGHLPPSLRRRLLQVGQDRAPARYSDRIRQYYESLARGRNQGNQ